MRTMPSKLNQITHMQSKRGKKRKRKKSKKRKIRQWWKKKTDIPFNFYIVHFLSRKKQHFNAGRDFFDTVFKNPGRYLLVKSAVFTVKLAGLIVSRLSWIY